MFFPLTGGMFQVENFDAAVALQDNFAPDRIRDLVLTEAVYGTDKVTMRWTSPGDDIMYGTGMCYPKHIYFC